MNGSNQKPDDEKIKKSKLNRLVEQKSRTKKIKQDIIRTYQEKQDAGPDKKEGCERIINENVDKLIRFLNLDEEDRKTLKEAILERYS